MTKKQQPKVSEMVEILIQQMNEFESAMAERNQELICSISKINSIKVDFNFEELEAKQKLNRKNLELYLSNFQVQAKKNNKEILDILNKNSFKKILYLIILNTLLLSSISFSLYLKATKSFDKPEYEILVKERNDLKHQVNSFKKFIIEYPEAGLNYQKWLRN